MTRAIAIFVTANLIFSSLLHAGARTCRIVYPGRPQEALKVAHLFDGSKSRPVTLPSMNLSSVIELPDGEISIALTTDEIDSPELLPAEAPSIKVPEMVRDFYLILTPDPKNEYLPVQMILADVGEGKILSGETLWYNFTEHRIVAKLGVADMSVDPHGQTVSKPPANANGHYAASFQYQARGEGPMDAITEQNWWHDPKCKSLGLIVDSGGRLPKIMVLRDFREAAGE